jgi:hypothetical protein
MSQEQEARGQEHEVRNQDPEARDRGSDVKLVVVRQEAGEHEVRHQARGQVPRNMTTKKEVQVSGNTMSGVRKHRSDRTQC